MNTVYIVMPAYNEETNIKDVVQTWYPVLEGKSRDSKLVIADSGSTDATHSILTAMQEEYPGLKILSETAKQHGPKLIALYQYAIDQGAEFVFQTDSDGQTSPDEFGSFWNLRKKYDAVLGYRKVRGDGKSRAFVEQVVCFLLWMFFGVRVPDANAPFRLMNTGLVKKYLGRLPLEYNIPNIMMTTFFVYYNEKVHFKKITFKPRQGGVNSINIPKIVGIGWQALHDFRQFRKGMK